MANNTLILGASISGLGAAYALREKGKHPLILEKDNIYGGLCGNFVVKGFRFDRFIHLSFTKDPQVLQIFNQSVGEVLTHVPNPYNIYQKKWIKHPVQNNLYPLDNEEKKKS